MPVIQTVDPLSAGLQAAASYMQQKKKNELDAQNQQLQQAVINSQLETAAANRQHQTFEEGRETANDVQQAKVDAANQLHQERDDAIRIAQVRLAVTKDKQDYDLKVRQLNQAHDLGVAKLKNDQTVAAIHATATEAAAQIHAAATVQAAGIHAAAEERGQDISHEDRVAERGVIKRGQDLAHQDRVRGQNATATRMATNRLTNAMLRLQTSKTPVAPPTDDPNFNQALQIFAKASPQQRDEMLKHPNLPDSTRAYLQAISPLLDASP